MDTKKSNRVNGYQAPNYTQIPNDMLDNDLPSMGKAECKVVLAIARKTFGWHKESDRISISQLEDLTGLSRQGVISGIDAAIKRGNVEKIEHETGPNEYKLVVNPLDQRADKESNNLTRVVKTVDQQVVKLVDTQKKVVKETYTKEKDSRPLPKKPEVEDDDAEAEKPKLSQHPAVQKFREVTHRYPAKAWYQDIVDTVGDDLEEWESIVKDWVGLGWNPTNVKGMLDVKRRGWSKNGRDGHKGTSDPDVISGDTRARDQVAKMMKERKGR